MAAKYKIHNLLFCFVLLKNYLHFMPSVGGVLLDIKTGSIYCG